MTSKTPQKRITVPSGYIFVHDKWKGSSLVQELNRKCRGCCYEDLGVVDFLTSSDYPIVFVTETDMLSPTIYKSKLKKFSVEYHGKGVVITCRNISMMETFSDIQELAVIQLSLSVIPITSQSDLPELLLQMIKVDSKSPHNPFKFKKSKEETQDDRMQQVALLSKIPGVREAKALRLLKAFGTITALSNASFEKLSDVVGNAVAHSVKDFIQSDEREKNRVSNY